MALKSFNIQVMLLELLDIYIVAETRINRNNIQSDRCSRALLFLILGSREVVVGGGSQNRLELFLLSKAILKLLKLLLVEMREYYNYFVYK